MLLTGLLRSAASFFGLVLLAVIGGIFSCVWLVQRAARGRVFDDLRRIATRGHSQVALVLGTSKVTPNGWPNAHFSRRLDAAAALYHAGGVRRLIVSGSAHNSRDENEPADMRAGLRERGVPDSAITEDPAGFRTLDSVVRAREVFGLTQLTIVTDGFHAPRAVFLSRWRAGIDVIALASAPVSWRRSRKTRLREFGADVRACMDTFILRTRPRG